GNPRAEDQPSAHAGNDRAAGRRRRILRLGRAAGRHDPQPLRRPDRSAAVDRVRAVPTGRHTEVHLWLNRAEDLAGLFIVLMIALSAVIAAWEAIDRMLNPRPMENIGWVIVAGIIGFLGNEAVAVYRIRVGRKI